MATYPDFLAGQTLTAATMRDLRDLTRTKFKDSDESVTSSTVLQDDNELFLSVDANATYEFKLLAYVQSAADNAGDVRYQFSLPSGSALSGAATGPVHTITTGDAGSGTWLARLSNSSFPFAAANNFAMGASIAGRLVVGGTAGTFQLQWAQNSSNASATTVKAGSWLRLRRVG